MRMRDQSPMFTTSAMAPMVQKWVRCANAPNSTDSAKALHSTVVVRACRSDSFMDGLWRRPGPSRPDPTPGFPRLLPGRDHNIIDQLSSDSLTSP